MATVLEQMQKYVHDTIKEHKTIIKMSRSDIIADVITKKYHNAAGSIIPSDYCYNRFNLGLFRKNNVKLFLWDKDEDLYEFVGENADCSDLIFGDSEHVNNDIIGECKHGKRILYDKYLDYARQKGKNIVKEYYE